MSDMPSKKEKHFKEIIEEDKNRGKISRKIMRFLTSIDTSIIYGGSFLFVFILIAVTIYYIVTPEIIVWTAILVIAALISSFFASKVTQALKRNQWRFKA